MMSAFLIAGGPASTHIHALNSCADTLMLRPNQVLCCSLGNDPTIRTSCVSSCMQQSISKHILRCNPTLLMGMQDFGPAMHHVTENVLSNIDVHIPQLL